MVIIVAILVMTVIGAAAFVTKVFRSRLMAELCRKPPQLGRKPAVSTEWHEDHRRRVAQLPADVREAHQHSSNHRAEVLASVRCGCFYCCTTFSPRDIEEWTDEANGEGQTAICPRCGIDSVLGERAGFDFVVDISTTDEVFLVLMG